MDCFLSHFSIISNPKTVINQGEKRKNLPDKIRQFILTETCIKGMIYNVYTEVVYINIDTRFGPPFAAGFAVLVIISFDTLADLNKVAKNKQ